MADSSAKKQSASAGQAAINIETGLAQYENNEEMYSNILENFAKNNKNTLSKLKDSVDVGDIKLAHRTAHSLRGAAGTIGATRLANATLDVENALTFISGAGSDLTGGEAFREQMILLENEFDTVFDELRVLVGENVETRRCPGVIDRNKVVDLIDKLTPFLKAGDTKCLEYLGEIEEAFRPVSEGFLLFISQVEQYDFEKAYETMEMIRHFMAR